MKRKTHYVFSSVQAKLSPVAEDTTVTSNSHLSDEVANSSKLLSGSNRGSSCRLFHSETSPPLAVIGQSSGEVLRDPVV